MGKVGLTLAAGCAAAACVVAAVMVGRSVRRRRGWRRVVRVLEELEEGCATTVGRLRQVVDAMAVEMHAGLASEGGSKLKMLLTYVHNLPTGNEKGIYYALDLGGTNFRVLRVKLGGQRRIIEHDVDLQPIPQHLMTSSSVVGRDVSQCLQEALSRKGLDMQVTVLVINMEWGNFWSSHLPRTPYDAELDADSPHPNDQGFEKMISGLYLGDIVRRVILRMSQESDVFGPVSSKLLEPFILRTPMIAAMHEDDSSKLSEVAQILNDTLEIPDVPLNVRKLVVKVCDVVTRRAARLAAAGIVGILKKIGRDGNGGIAGGKTKSGSRIKMRRTVVAVEGGLYTNYTMFREYLNEAMGQILGEDVAPYVILKVTNDGSGIGAALLAASHSASTITEKHTNFIGI
ncbi:UNVERIFIED_CONTAM: Hexokinase-3 [Sesamum angustifolium]|uniref:Phosphotransferase n=1 Tax=Sesamum angustifolium TaxID=2727405 RepID=A0AAW2QUM1_9LAMI